VFSNANQQTNVYGDDVEVDYRGYEVSLFLANNELND
jgi:phosphatidylinositol glycan class K